MSTCLTLAVETTRWLSCKHMLPNSPMYHLVVFKLMFVCVSFRTGLKPGQSMEIAKKMQFSCDKATQEVRATR